MGKIRGVHPEFWTDEDIVDLSIPARLLFIGLWNLACDNGHLDDKPKQIKMRILPGDDVNVDALLDELVWHKRIERKDGTITIHKFAEHQKPHRKWWKVCGLPGCTVPEGAPPQGRNGGKGSSEGSDNGGATVAQPGTTVEHGCSTADCDVEGDVEGDTQQTSSVVAADADAPPKKPRETRTRSAFRDFEPNESCRRIAEERGVDLAAEYVKLRDWAVSKAEKRADWQATLRNWLRNAKATPPARPSNTNGFLDDLRAGIYGPEAIG